MCHLWYHRNVCSLGWASRAKPLAHARKRIRAFPVAAASSDLNFECQALLSHLVFSVAVIELIARRPALRKPSGTPGSECTCGGCHGRGLGGRSLARCLVQLSPAIFLIHDFGFTYPPPRIGEVPWPEDDMVNLLHRPRTSIDRRNSKTYIMLGTN